MKKIMDSKKSILTEGQYGEWLRASNRRIGSKCTISNRNVGASPKLSSQKKADEAGKGITEEMRARELIFIIGKDERESGIGI